jgi:hypothetical protein
MTNAAQARVLVGWPALALAFGSGWAVMVIELAGVRLLGREFGSSFYVWTSQIGVILLALALGYDLGGRCADRCQRALGLALALMSAGGVTVMTPDFAELLMGAVAGRHAADMAVPEIWRKLDPALVSGLLFLWPCGVLAAVVPWVIRARAAAVGAVGRVSGRVFAAGAAGSIAGVFLTGYVLLDVMGVTAIFRLVGIVVMMLGLLALNLDWPRGESEGV